MATYAGTFKNPTEDMRVAQNAEGKWFIEVARRCDCGHECCSRPIIEWTPHTSGNVWDDEDGADEAHEWLAGLSERAEEDYDNYLEENHDSIVQMERYEMWRNEY